MTMKNKETSIISVGPRCQADRDLYRQYMQELLRETNNLTIREGTVDDLILENIEPLTSNGYHVRSVTKGVILSNKEIIHAKAVILTTGTFLGGIVYIGDQSFPAGRMGENSVSALSTTLKRIGFPLARMRTGTPPRLSGKTIDYKGLQKQESDNPPLPFSFLNNAVNIPLERMVTCYQTFTTFSTHKIVSENLHLAPKLIGNEGKGNGPRYCPSLEAKVIKYPEKKHHIWLEPEGLSTDIVYPNGEKFVFSFVDLLDIRLQREFS